MAVNFGVPPLGETIRSLVEERLKAAMSEQGAKITVEWRGEQKHLHVISMPVDMLYFNPDTHRIRAQRTLEPERNRILEEEPWGEGAQNYLFDLLRRDPANPNQTDSDYTALQDELDDFGQKEPGIMSPLGIIVDGNTRCAALRELGVKDIRVGVLPEDTSRRDINSVELALQLRKDKRRDYSYINRLIAIEDELSSGRREEDVARDFNIKTTTLQQDRWVFQLIDDAIDRSSTEHGAALRLVDFEDHQEKLRELQRDFTKLAKTDTEAAEQLKESRLAMVVLNYPKTSVRLAESDFHARYLDERLPDDLRPASQESAALEIPGLPGVVVEDASAAVKTTRALTDALLQAKAVTVTKQLGEPGVAEADNTIKTARKTFDVAVKLAGANVELRKRQIAVPERLTDAADYVNQCVKEFADAKAKRALDEDAFDDALLTLRTSLSHLAKQARRTFSSPGDGVAWLLDATREK
ncbi:ParB/RepB/Spo0J family partition protein [Streptomyces boluensis]|uniref:ParB N-terminal domain-containing protein n=1 Tax=Streptomyces boluensis TaxID=1775135 RepID=A0A964XN84_9ACTN|nr:ParB/RepB/Spo0J family partition protein [Streptomyces boluensis]NBE53318.1 ParB N-terminal domain-containing protein [Streptomyces boluensis]